MKRILALLLVITLAISLFPLGVFAEETATAATLEELQTAIADGAASITVTATIDITSEITIDGNGCTIYRGSNLTSGAVFNVKSAGNLILSNLTVDGNHVSASKALIENSGTFTLNADATLTNGINSSQAGALNNNKNAGTAYIYGMVSHCTGVNGGAIRNYEGATLTIGDSALLEENTSTSNGGALHQSGYLTVGAATFRNNTSNGSYSGAIHVGNTGSTSLTGTIFEGNSTKGKGGIMYISGNGSATVENISVTGKLSDDNTPVTVAVHAGAIIVGSNAVLNINGTRNLFQNLQAEVGGVIYNNGGTVTIAGGTFTNNRATSEDDKTGGGVIFNTATLTINGGSYTNNSAAKVGGAIYNNGGNVTITDSTFTGNTAEGGGGGAFVSDAGTFTINSGTYQNNTASSRGGVVNTSGKATVNIYGGTFTGNTAGAFGGALHASGSGTINLYGGTVINNNAGEDIYLNNTATSSLCVTTGGENTLMIGNVDGNGGIADNFTIDDIAQHVKSANSDGSYTYYADVASAANSGKAIQLMGSQTAEFLSLDNETSLDLNGYTLTASGVSAVSGANVIDSTGNGLLVTPKDNLVLSDSNKQVAVWNGTDGYIFGGVDFYLNSNILTTDDGSYKIGFVPAPNAAIAELLKDGSADNDVQIILQVTWDGQEEPLELAFSNELIQDLYTKNNGIESKSYLFFLTFTGVENLTNLKITPYFTGAGGTKDVCGYTWEMNNTAAE